ncbi:MAG: polysaccharide deacetylase family protein [Actinomycetota bacterium]|nr:polysaccharide deacetylase family protein [Actinomycetota bacterium]
MSEGPPQEIDPPPPPGRPAPRSPARGRGRPRRGSALIARTTAGAGLVAVVLAALLILGVPGGGSGHSTETSTQRPRSTTTAKSSTTPARTAPAPVPVLMYHVVANAPAGVANPSLYVPQDQFSAQMQALKAAGWHAVTLDQLEGYWTQGKSLGPGKPIVLTFDTGYHSQYANALPVLKSLGWVGDEELVVNGLPPSEGGISGTEVRGLIAAGWEVDTQGLSHTDLTTVGSGQLTSEVASARQTLQQQYGIPVHWFSYPLGHYDANVIAAVKSGGYTGATTVAPGLASKAGDPYRLPRLAVLPGTSPSALVTQIASARGDSAAPASYSGPGFA